MRLVDADALKAVIINQLLDGGGTQLMWSSDVMDAIDHAPTVGEGIADSLDCFRRIYTPYGIVCEQTQCKWRCEGRDVGLNHGYCAANNLMADIVRLFGGNPGYGVVLRDRGKEGEVG